MARNNIIPIFVSHIGCPHQCVFCNQMEITGQCSMIRSNDVNDILTRSLKYSGIRPEVAFYGGSFTAVSEAYQIELLEAVQPFLNNGIVSGIRVSTRPDAISEEKLNILERYQVKTIEIGCQSMDETVLKLSGRGHTATDIYNAVAMIKKHSFRLILQMMTGLPGSTAPSDLETARKLAELCPDGIRVYPTIVVRGTKLYNYYLEGRYVPQTLDEAVNLSAKISSIMENAEIPVLRFGLQPTKELSNGEAVAGPYHPAFGELVASQKKYELLCDILSKIPESKVLFTTDKKQISELIGQHGINREKLKREFPTREITFAEYESQKYRTYLKKGWHIVKI